MSRKKTLVEELSEVPEDETANEIAPLPELKTKKEKQEKAAELLAEGKSKRAVAKAVGVNELQLYRWENDPKYTALRDRVLKDKLTSLAMRAQNVLAEQLNAKNEWVRQNAARELIQLYQKLVLDAEKSDMVIRIEGMPKIGMPHMVETVAASLPGPVEAEGEVR